MKKLTYFLWIAIALVSCSHTPSTEAEDAEISAYSRDDEDAIPMDAEAASWIKQGYAEYRRGDFPRAIQRLEAAAVVGNLKAQPWAMNILFYCYLATGSYAEAGQIAREVARHRPYDSLSYEQLGIAELWSRKPKQALEHFARAREFEAHATNLFFYEGLAHAALGNQKARDTSFQRAESEYRDILKRNPRDLTANIELATMLLLWNRSVSEVGILTTAAREAIASGVEEEQSWNQRLITRFYLPKLEGGFLAVQKQPKAARKLLIDALNNAPSGARAEVAEIYLFLSTNSREEGDLERARMYYDKAVSLDPSGPYLAVWKQGNGKT